MKRLVRTELLKQRTTPIFVVGLASAPALGALVTVAVFGAAGSQGNAPLGAGSLVEAVGAPASIVTVVALLLGVLGMAGEFRHETITTTFLACPRRRDVVAAKLAAHALTGAALGLLSAAASLAVAVPWLHSAGVPLGLDAHVARVAGGLVLCSALYGALGVSLGALVRNQTAAVAAVLVWVLAVEGILGDVFARSAVVDWLPVAAGRAVVQAGSSPGGLAGPAAAAVFAGWVAVAAFAAVRLTLRRDIT